MDVDAQVLSEDGKQGVCRCLLLRLLDPSRCPIAAPSSRQGKLEENRLPEGSEDVGVEGDLDRVLD